MMPVTVKSGDIFIFNALKGGWFSKVQRFVTRMEFTHSAVGVNAVYGQASEIDAYFCVTVQGIAPWEHDEQMEFYQYRLKPGLMSQDEIDACVAELYAERAADEYGYLQVLPQLVRWVGETFRRDMRRMRNPFPHGTICSELDYTLFAKYARTIAPFGPVLAQWNPQIFHSGDTFSFCDMMSDCFDLVNYRCDRPNVRHLNPSILNAARLAAKAA